jgi:hypothetical protein
MDFTDISNLPQPSSGLGLGGGLGGGGGGGGGGGLGGGPGGGNPHGELPSYLQPTHVGKKEHESVTPSYSPDQFNIHSHPYYGKARGDVSEFPKSTSPDQSLPPRDIPMHDAMTDRQLDPASRVGYIPPIPSGARVSEEYLRQRSMVTDREMRDYQFRKYREAQIGNIIDTIQIPLFLALLFFIFNTHYTNKWIFQATATLGGHDESGNINTVGLAIKSLIFGAFYYAMNMIMEWIVHI